MCVRVRVHTSHSHLQPLFKNDLDKFVRLNLAAYNMEVYFHNYALQGYSCTLWVWTCDLGCIVKQFMISFFFPLVHDKHLQTSPELTTMTTYNEGVKKMKQQKSPLSSLPPSPLPCPLIPLFFFTLMCFCSLWRWRGEIERGSGGGQILLHIWGLFGLPLGSAVKFCISRKLPALSGRLGTLTNTHTCTHTHTCSSAGLSVPFSLSQWQSLSAFLVLSATILWCMFPSNSHYFNV